MSDAVTLDTTMPARAVLARLARHGFWRDPNEPEAARWIQAHAARAHVAFAEAAARLARDPEQSVAAIRRQWFANVLWYSRSIREVLTRCLQAHPEAPLLDVLNLHEPDSRPAVPVETAASAPRESVVLDGDVPVGVGPSGVVDVLAMPTTRARGIAPDDVRRPKSEARRGQVVWPRLDAPDYRPAGVPFEVVVGFGRTAQSGVAGAQIVLEAAPGVERIELTVVLIATGLDAPDGWSRPLVVAVADPTQAEARFSLVGRAPVGQEPVHLTSIEARYIREGMVIGTAARPMVIGLPNKQTLDTPDGVGMPWLAQPPGGTSVDLRPGLPVDLTIELAKPDRNAATGVYSCRLYSPHPLSVSGGPYDVDLGQDARTFARMVVDQVRQYSSNDLLVNLLDSFGDAIADQFPADVFDAVAEVAQRTAPSPPSVLILSADPYVPWELARMRAPLDPSRPPYLGAQVLLGRWLQDGQSRRRNEGDATTRPPAQPPFRLPVRHIAVMAGKYREDSGLRALPQAEAEAQAIIKTYDGVGLAASPSSLKRLLDATLEKGTDPIGGADVVHFAGHGEFDPARPDSSVLFLNDGLPLSSLLFRSAKYGGAQQPLFFLNACMIGIGGQLLGDMGGFPGNCLKGGFGGVLGALWEVDDRVAAEIALEFWDRAMPSGGAGGEPVGAILRDLRARYMPDEQTTPESTYLAYVYYGHPLLTLQPPA